MYGPPKERLPTWSMQPCSIFPILLRMFIWRGAGLEYQSRPPASMSCGPTKHCAAHRMLTPMWPHTVSSSTKLRDAGRRQWRLQEPGNSESDTINQGAAYNGFHIPAPTATLEPVINLAGMFGMSRKGDVGKCLR